MRRFAFCLGLLLAAAPAALAQQPPQTSPPPARVGRVSFVQGQLAFHLVGQTQWSAAALNCPVATGGSYWTDPQSRAEVRVGSETIDLSNNTEIDVTRLDEQVMQIAVPQGRIDLNLRQLAPGSTVEIDIPRGAVSLLQPGIYDIDAGTADQPARVSVFAGSASFSGGSSPNVSIAAGSAAVISGTPPSVTASLTQAVPDAFYQWCRSRDYQIARVASLSYVSPQMTGYAELDQYGSWDKASEYGAVWYPSSLPAGWAPYREGHWAWVPPWGWTWVDDAPWGFAPFHYGRWARIGGRWAWVPGNLVAQPVYAPALVAFIGAPGVGIALAGVAGPAVGWFPLAPGEIYWPTYAARDPAYIRRLNIANVSETKIVNITNIINRSGTAVPAAVASQSFANRAAATVVPARSFASATPAARAAVTVDPQVLARAPVAVRPPVTRPTPAAAAAATRSAFANAPPIRPANLPATARAAGVPAAVHPAARHAPPATAPAGAAATAAAHRPATTTTRVAPAEEHPVTATTRAAPAEHPSTGTEVHPAATAHAATSTAEKKVEPKKEDEQKKEDERKKKEEEEKKKSEEQK